MDEATGAAIKEDGAENDPFNGDRAAENDPFNGERSTENSNNSLAEDTADRVGVFCCRDCGEAFGEEAAYLEHRQQHPQENCVMYLDDQLGGLHDSEKDSDVANFCTICSMSFVELSEFHSHMESNHGQTSHKESGIQIVSGTTKQHTYECTDCGKSYGVIGHFLNHQRSHRQASKSVFHDLEHLKKKSFQCESCGRNYSRASALDAHRRCHEGKLVKSRNRSSGDSFHIEETMAETKPSENQTDDTEKLFKCSCGKAFTALLRLKTHQRFSRNSQCTPEEMKEKEKPKKSCSEFYCSECKKGFNGHIALFNHQRWHANHSDESAKRFPCEECGKVFMTLTFYYRHQRMAHSDETPSKSFHHQVCQLQKKAFECKDCGLKFSRASALHSHQLHHTDVFRETEGAAQTCLSLLPPQKVLEGEMTQQVESENVPLTNVAEEDSQVNETDEDMESYEPGDFNVQVISASESEDEPVQDLNPDLELLCESDQEGRDDSEIEISPINFVSKPEMDLKIVQIDFEPAEEPCTLVTREAEDKPTVERFDCPDCYRWFTSASSLRVHRMWHGIHKRRQQTQGQSVAVYTSDTCGHEASSYAAHCSHIQEHKDLNTSANVLYQAEELDKKKLKCDKCGKCFSRLSALVSHQLHHPKRKQFQCPDCMMSYSYAASLFNHMNNCPAQKKENISVTKKEYNPKKTLLGPKIYHCEQCGKGFWSLGAYSHHKQSQTECAALRLRKGSVGNVHSVNGGPRSSLKVACPVCGRKFRHKGIMALHMRKHENGNHKCELCNRSFRLFSSLLRHQVVHNDQLLPPPVKSFQHQVEQLKKNTYSCPDCGKLFSRAKALQFHMKSHGYETGHSLSSPRATVKLEDLQCPTCLAHFNNKASLRAHQKLCIKRDSQVAHYKTETSENNDTLKLAKDSMDVHTQESSEQSAVNTEVKNEIDTEELKIESQGFETDLKYKCKKCDRSFSVIGALNFHKRVHTEGHRSVAKAKSAMSPVLKQPKQEVLSEGFHCSECGRRFMTSSALGSHKRWHSEKTFSHSLLKEQFLNRCALENQQMLDPQSQTTTEPDPDSNKSMESNSTLDHPELSCPECNKTFDQGSLLAAHYENKHSKSLEAEDLEGDGSADQVSEQGDVNLNGTESDSLTLKRKTHQCPICSCTFTKARGLRAHKWQAHSKSAKGKNKVPWGAQKESLVSSSEVKNSEDAVVDSAAVTSNDSVAKKKRQRKIRLDPFPVKPVSCLDCGIQCSSPAALIDHKKVCLEGKQEIQTPEATAEVSPPLSRLSEHTAKCLFKCDKCGKAFQTEEQLGTHKTKAKSRPYCCALCCQGFWTENQLQQHLAWHDEVRCRLPNEVRFRLSAAMTTKPLKPNILPADDRGKSFPSSTLNRPTLSPDSQSQSSHKCQHCGKAFLSPAALHKHETQHCNNDSYHCSICPRTFAEIQDLISHHQECIGDYKTQSHTPAAVSSGDTNGLTCLECGTTFCQETDLHQHYIEHAQGVF
ncbi:zinc finger protein 208 [Scomber japonicus]|uniref:zinc finger protein 208 n=1 Tax=Scomber japonicus TaxID=13676 RepID=UPI0023068539|nr:zinc finger protein 208 [Scomber japonicus]